MTIGQVNPLLDKPVLCMRAGDWAELSTMAIDSIKRKIVAGSEHPHFNYPVGNPTINLTGHLPEDLFDYKGELTKTAKKGIKTAIKEGRLPKKATIGTFYNQVMQNYEQNYEGKLTVIQELYALLVSNLKRTNRLQELPKLSSELFAKFFK